MAEKPEVKDNQPTGMVSRRELAYPQGEKYPRPKEGKK
jgi:hypothetical protein